MTSVIENETRGARTSTGSILRWMGSKKRTAESIVGKFPTLTNGATYFEPFFGGGSIFFALEPSRSILGDSNAALMNAWRWIQNEGDLVWAKVAALEVSATNYYTLRAQREDPDSFTDAVRFVYLNRYCFNGIYRTNRRDEFNVPFGRNTGALPARDSFLACSARLSNSTLHTGDFAETTQYAVAGDLVYLDPPWQAARATYGEYGYTNHLDVTPERVREVAVDLHSRGVTTFISLPKSVSGTFSNWPMVDLEVNYRVASKHSSRSKQTELLVTLDHSSRSALTE